LASPEDLREAVRRLKALTYFYDAFLKLAISGVREVVGERGADVILKAPARQYGLSVCKGLKALGMNLDPIGVLKQVLEQAGTMPEIRQDGSRITVKLRRCPFHRPWEEPLLCHITEGFLTGLVEPFSAVKISRKSTMAEGAETCIFELVLEA